MLVLALAALTAQAQQGDPTKPPREYYIAMVPYIDGDYQNAARGFQDAAKAGIRSTEGRWVDSICYHTMLGECFYQMGDNAKALEQYDSALKLAVFHINWMLRIEFPDLIEPSASTVQATINWGIKQRPTRLGRIAEVMYSLQGRPDNQTVLDRTGGVIMPPELYPLNVKEIVRCTALAIYRRHQIMGPLCQHDPFTGQLVAALARRPTRPNHWSQGWISCQLGLAYASAGKAEQAVSELTKSLALAGQFDHDLTALGLLKLGELAFDQGQYANAASLFLECTFAAAAFEQYHLMREAFRWGLVTHFVSGQKGLYAPLEPASVWARRDSRALQAWLMLLLAENYAAVGNTAQASRALSQVSQATGTRDMRSGELGAYFNYQSAAVDFQGGNLSGGTKTLKLAMNFMQASSRRLFQINLADRFYVSGAFSQRVADDVFSDVLREPTSSDWSVNPMETLAVVLTPHPLPIQHWFDVAMQRKDFEKALDISDLLRRHRFYSTLPVGGRVLALRWVLEAPDSLLDQASLLQRQDLLGRYPVYAQLSAQAAAIGQKLEALPPVPTDPVVAGEQGKLLDQLAQISLKQEAAIQDLALRREPSNFVFPPHASAKEIQQGMTEDQLALAFLLSDMGLTAFAVSKDKITAWQVEKPAELNEKIGNLLKQIGLTGSRYGVDPAVLLDDSWKATSAELLQTLTDNADAAAWSPYRELIVVPESFLWYVPFEALHLKSGGDSKPLISGLRVRYAPTLGLINSAGQPSKPKAETVVVTGQMYAGQDRQVTMDAYKEINAVLPDSSQLTDRLPAPAAFYSSVLDRLIVLSDQQRGRGVYAWAPMCLDRDRAGNSLDSWFALPWRSPAEIVLPGFHSAAENALSQGGDGNDIFLAACGLMATGARSILISRWPVAGQSTYDLIREYAQELPYTSAAEAWQRSVQVARHQPIDPALEPRLKAAGPQTNLTAGHPFFWAGFALIDTGNKPQP
jgi:tetratricopeptide (TPR) repeat protein